MAARISTASIVVLLACSFVSIPGELSAAQVDIDSIVNTTLDFLKLPSDMVPVTACDGTLTPLPSAYLTTGIPTQTEPAVGTTYVDQLHGTCITRMTDHVASGINNFIRNDYSRRQAFNADDSLIVCYVSGGTWRMLDAETGADLGQLPGLVGDAEPQWHHQLPNVLFYIPDRGGMTVNRLDVTTGQTTIVADFTGRLPWPNAARVWTGSEGSPSLNNRWWAFMVETSSGEGLGLMVWDRARDKVTATYDFNKNGVTGPDYVTMTPNGRYVVAGFDTPTGVVAFTRNFNVQVQISPQGEHSDIARLANGRDAYVFLDFESNGGPVRYVDIAQALFRGSPVPVDLFDTYLGNGSYTSIHFSGKSFARKGWVLASTYGGGGPYRWYKHSLLAIELKPNGKVLGIGHHHGEVSTYFEEIHASVNRDFTKVIYNSNFDNGNGVDIYLVEDLAWVPDED